MRKFTLLSIAMLAMCAFGYAQDKTYYINGNSPADGGGNNSNSGLAPNAAWATIAQANTLNLQPGDKILLFSAGNWHNGSFYFDQSDLGTPAKPITISTYGPNPTANVWTDGSFGVFAGNTSSIKIENINFYGNRTFAGGGNNSSGINFYTDGAPTHRPYIFINNCRLEGFGEHGILIQSWNPDIARAKGFSDITITNTIVNNCGKSGINIGAFGDNAISSNFVHKNILIENVRARKNAGYTTVNTVATGNGIVVSSAETVLINKCVADENGRNSNFPTAGIAGIWFYNVKNGIIQNSEAFKNYAGNTNIDGNGFGIDGGCQNCVIQYCYSHDNEGAGYGVFEFGSPNRHENNTIRYNISQNDARANSFGALKFWGVDAANKVNDVNVYNNTFFLNANNLVNNANLPSGIRVLGNHLNNVKVANNIFYLSAANLSFTRTVDMTNQPLTILPSELLMVNNLYFNSAGAGNFNWGAQYSNLAAWRTATNQEKINSTNYGVVVDPNLASPGGGGQVAPAVNETGGPPHAVGFGGDVKTVTQYQTTATSPARGTGANLNTLFAINIGSVDYYNFSLGSNAFDIGAHQSANTLPLSSLKSFSLSKQANSNELRWEMTEVKLISSFNLECSTDGKEFKNLGGSIPATANLRYSYVDFNPSATITYYRLKGVDLNGEVWYSKILVARNELSKADFSIYPVPLNNSTLVFDWEKDETVTISVNDLSGKIVFSRLVLVKKGKNQVDLSELDKLSNGMYVVNILGASKKSFSRKVVK